MLFPVPFYFLRHGETDWNADGIMQGQTDVPLNETGVQQAGTVARTIFTLPIVTVCCSSLQRARHTAEIVTAGLNLTIVAIDDLRECRFGIYEGRPSDSAWRDEWAQSGLLRGGETHDAYLNRALKGLNTALAHPGPVLVVAHGGTFWAIQRFALNGQPVRIANCVLFRLDPPHEKKAPWRTTEVAVPGGLPLAIGEGTAAH